MLNVDAFVQRSVNDGRLKKDASEQQARRIGPVISRRENTSRRHVWKVGVAPNKTCLCVSLSNQASAVLVVMHLKHETFGSARRRFIHHFQAQCVHRSYTAAWPGTGRSCLCMLAATTRDCKEWSEKEELFPTQKPEDDRHLSTNRRLFGAASQALHDILSLPRPIIDRDMGGCYHSSIRFSFSSNECTPCFSCFLAFQMPSRHKFRKQNHHPNA
jgi:hypothetical protein